MKKQQKTAHRQKRRVERRVRARRLDKIRSAERDLESALLTLKNHFGITWTGPSFTNLYSLVRLARKAP